MATDPAASTIAESAIAIAGAALAISSAFAGAALAIGSTLTNCHSDDNQHAAIITRVAADASAHYRGSGAGCAPCHWTANSPSLAGGIRLLSGP
jgi:hypothetical protein